MGDNKFASTIKRLKNAKQIKNEIRITDNGKVTSEYFLTKDTKIRRLWQINKRIETKRVSRSVTHQSVHNKTGKTKAFLLITYFAAFGYEDLKSEEDPSKAKLGEVRILTSNKDGIQEYSLGGEKKPGVSIDDLVNKLPGINRSAIFTYMDYSESELKRYFSLLIKQKSPILTKLQEGDKEIATIYGIASKDLEIIIKKCWVMFYTVLSRMEYTWTYIRWPRPGSNEANWYVTFFGTRVTEELLKRIEKKRSELDKKNEQEKQDFISKIHDEIKRNDINIIASYKQLLSSNYYHIRKKYRLIVNPLLEECYPYFIRTLHKTNEI
jgi:hypothetical protein